MKDTENKNEDVQARLKALAEESGFHTNVPIFEDSYSTLVAHQLANSSTEQTKEKKRRKVSDEDQRAIFRFLDYSSKDKPPIS
jgi:predicted DsbA family dithiol-disulfide isomerase